VKEQVVHIYQAILALDEKPSLQDIEAAFERDGLDLTTRLLCAVAVLTSLGRLRHLRFFIGWAMIEDVSLEKVQETILQCYLFAGYPAAIEGFFVLRDVLKGRGLDSRGAAEESRIETWRERGLALCQRVYGEKYGQLRRNLGEISPELDEWMIVEGYGKVLSRPGLDLVTRELCTTAALTALGWPRQLLSHIRGALNVGAERREIQEAILQARLFVDPALIEQALDLAK